MPRFVLKTSTDNRYLKYKSQFVFLLQLFIKKLLKQGKKQKAIKAIYKIFKQIRILTNENAYNIFLIALDHVSPEFYVHVDQHPVETIETEETEGPEKTIEFLSDKKSYIKGMSFILKVCKKKTKICFLKRVANEIINAYHEKGDAIQLRLNFEKEALKNVPEITDPFVDLADKYFHEHLSDEEREALYKENVFTLDEWLHSLNLSPEAENLKRQQIQADIQAGHFLTDEEENNLT